MQHFGLHFTFSSVSRQKLASFCRETLKLLLRNGLTAFLGGGAARQFAVRFSKTGPTAASAWLGRQSEDMADLPRAALARCSETGLSQWVEEGTISVSHAPPDSKTNVK